jgi:hypothetical protein
MATRRRTWIDQATDTYLDELAKYGLDAPREIVARELRGRLAAVAAGLGIGEQSAKVYLPEEIIRELAETAAVGLAGEQPGADMTAAPRNVPVPGATYGRTIAALAQAAKARVNSGEPVGPDGALQALTILGDLYRRQPPGSDGVVWLPQAVLSRSARFLVASAKVVRDASAVDLQLEPEMQEPLAEAFEKDATTLRELVAEHGSPEGPGPGDNVRPSGLDW